MFANQVLYALLAFACGFASHQLVFIHGELDNFFTVIIQVFLLLWGLLIVLTGYTWGSPLTGLLLGTFLFLVYQAGLTLSIVIYRLCFHPLQNFPGSRAFYFWQWRAAYEQFRTERYFTVIQRQHFKYGDFVRIGPNHISINRIDALRPVYEHFSLCRRGPWHDFNGRKFFLQRTRDRQAHDQERVFWSRALTDGALDVYVHRIRHEVQSLLQRLPEAEGTVDLRPQLKIYGFNVMAATIIGETFDEDRVGEIMRLFHLLEETQHVLGVLSPVPWAGPLFRFFPGITRVTRNFEMESARLLAIRLEKNPDARDLIASLLDARMDESSPGFPLANEFRLALTTGCLYNTYVPLTIIYQLSKHQDSLKQVYTEISSLVKSGSFDMRHSYPILDSVIQESLRLMPPTPNGGQMKAPIQGLQVGHTWIPADTIVKVPFYTLLRDERYFVEAESFIPERWTTCTELVRKAEAFVPFMLGPYSCVAREFAMIQARAVIAHIVTTFHFDFSAEEGDEGFENGGKDRYIMVYGPLRIRFTRRDKPKN